MGKNKSVKDKIANISGMWGKARETTKSEGNGDFVPVSAGTYVMQLVGKNVETFGSGQNAKRKLQLKWAVLDDGDDRGKICNEFRAIDDADNLMWLQRELTALGVDLDEAEIEDEDDLCGLIDQLIEARTCAHVKVVESDGYTNMRVRKLAEVDEDTTMDPSEALGGGASGSGKKAKKEEAEEEAEEGDDEETVDIGDRVTWTGKSGERAGEIVAWEGDDKAKVRADDNSKLVVVPLDMIAKETEEEEVEEAEEEVEVEEEAAEELELAVGCRVQFKSGKKTVEGEVTSMPPNGANVQVTTDDGTIQMVPKSKVEVIEAAGEEEEPRELAKGDKVLVTIKGKPMTGVVQSVTGDNAKIKLDKTKAVVQVAVADVDFQLDE
jgi:hypothetical protein